jgi:hypothetical protein
MYDFNKYPNKYTARQDTIINMYRNLTNNTSIPKNQSYITLCANQVENNNLIATSELKQILDNKLIKINQFYGIDTDRDTIEGNKAIRANWVCADLLSFLMDNIETINPAIINLDSVIYSKKKITDLLSDVILLLSENEKKCMVVANFCINNPNSGHKIAEIIDGEIEEYQKSLLGNRYYERAVESGWRQYPKYYVYSSTGRAFMATYIYYNC